MKDRLKTRLRFGLWKFKDWCQPLYLWGLSHRQAITPTLPWSCLLRKQTCLGKDVNRFWCVSDTAEISFVLWSLWPGIRASLDLGSKFGVVNNYDLDLRGLKSTRSLETHPRFWLGFRQHPHFFINYLLVETIHLQPFPEKGQRLTSTSKG